MKYVLLRTWARCRRMLGRDRRHDTARREATEIAQLLRRAQPFASWTERAHWMVEVAAWLREDNLAWSDARAELVCTHRRTRIMLDWLQHNREARRLVAAAVQKTLREALGPELYCGPGLPARSSVLGALLRGAARTMVPPTLVPGDLSALLLAMFPNENDARWLKSIDGPTRHRLWKLIADDGITHGLQQQVDEALHVLANTVLATGISPEVRQRLGRLPLRSTPFMSLRRELERFLSTPGSDEAAMRSVRMLLAVCQAQTDRVYEHLDEHGVSVTLVMEIEQLRVRLTRIARLIDLREAFADEGAAHAFQLFLAESVRRSHRPESGAMVGRSFSLLARKVVERNSDEFEYHIARNRAQYGEIVRAASVGGILAALAVAGILLIEGSDMAGFFRGLAYAGVLAVSMLATAGLGGSFAARQSPAVAPLLARRLGHVDSVEGMRALLREVASLARAQVGATLGNLMMLLPVLLVFALALHSFAGWDLVPAANGPEVVDSLSLFGLTPLLAVVTGLMCWLASIAAGLADNWFVLHRMREGLAHHRGLRGLLGRARTVRFADWCARHVSGITGAVSLALLLGMLPALGDFFGLPLDIRHGVLSAGVLGAALLPQGWQALEQASPWVAVLGVLAACVLNILTPLLCSLALAMHARHLGSRVKRAVLRAIGRRMWRKPASFLLPPASRAPVVVPRPQPRQSLVDAPPPDKDRTGTH